MMAKNICGYLDNKLQESIPPRLYEAIPNENIFSNVSSSLKMCGNPCETL